MSNIVRRYALTGREAGFSIVTAAAAAVSVRQAAINGSVSAGATTVTLPLATQSGSVLVVGGMALTALGNAITALTFTDSSSNAFTDSGSGMIFDSNFAVGSFDLYSRLGAFLSPTAGTTTVTITPTGGSNVGQEVWAYEVLGLSAAFDKVVTAHGNSNSADSGPTGVLSFANEFAACYTVWQSNTPSVGAGWSTGGVNINDGAGAVFTSDFLERQITSTTSSIDGLSGSSGISNWRCWCATLH